MVKLTMVYSNNFITPIKDYKIFMNILKYILLLYL